MKTLIVSPIDFVDMNVDFRFTRWSYNYILITFNTEKAVKHAFFRICPYDSAYRLWRFFSFLVSDGHIILQIAIFNYQFPFYIRNCSLIGNCHTIRP